MMPGEVDKLVVYIKDILGPKNKCLGRDWRMNFSDNLNIFLFDLPDEKRKKLIRILGVFRLHMEPIWVLIRKEEKNENRGSFSGEVWAKVAISIMTSLIDFLTKDTEVPRKSFVDFLAENFIIRIKNQEDIKILSNEHSQQYPPSIIKRLVEFYSMYLDAKDQEEIVNKYATERRLEGKIKIKNLKDVVQDIYNNIRSGFLHGTGLESMYTESEFFTSEDGYKTLTYHQTISVSQFLYLSWKAIFRYFGFTGEIDSKFTEEEKKLGKTYHGTQISFRLG